ncbi:hypothetical protein B0I35DRAFT_439135 [Stachybotrys elegans]|uniref:Uncharacterized protein n=1 Tax=Stachybotrys elegans TaxID=80388 RepID=A0A8K0WNG2_9HYPO|nr:hypothetical protein B0I35DRAFT_439135 [Stachybotrys elegans]
MRWICMHVCISVLKQATPVPLASAGRKTANNQDLGISCCLDARRARRGLGVVECCYSNNQHQAAALPSTISRGRRGTLQTRGTNKELNHLFPPSSSSYHGRVSAQPGGALQQAPDHRQATGKDDGQAQCRHRHLHQRAHQARPRRRRGAAHLPGRGAPRRCRWRRRPARAAQACPRPLDAQCKSYQDQKTIRNQC